ncbi:MAG: hypothetical protein MZV64_14830 [Ignavibacteriales bacterium]|nr:hypothetical protein [Ignavibacteriales bacterium]
MDIPAGRFPRRSPSPSTTTPATRAHRVPLAGVSRCTARGRAISRKVFEKGLQTAVRTAAIIAVGAAG